MALSLSPKRSELLLLARQAEKAKKKRARLKGLFSSPAKIGRAARTEMNATFNPQPKSQPLQHEGYMAAVRTLPCMRCGVVGFTQFCHTDEGKGMGLKTDCREGWPGCGPRDGTPGCHWFVGTSGQLDRQARRDLEAHYARRTRIRILGMGLWPANLAAWPEET